MQQYSVWEYVNCQMALMLLSGDTLVNLEQFWETWPDGFQIMFYHYNNQIKSSKSVVTIFTNFQIKLKTLFVSQKTREKELTRF